MIRGNNERCSKPKPKKKRKKKKIKKKIPNRGRAHTGLCFVFFLHLGSEQTKIRGTHVGSVAMEMEE